MFGLPPDALVSYAVGGAVLYFMRKHEDALRRDGTIYVNMDGACLLRIYDVMGLASVVAVLVILWRRQSLWIGVKFVLLSFLISMVIQLLLGFAFMRVGWDKITRAGFVVVPLTIGYTIFSLIHSG